jgi:hypothetical protein
VDRNKTKTIVVCTLPEANLVLGEKLCCPHVRRSMAHGSNCRHKQNSVLPAFQKLCGHGSTRRQKRLHPKPKDKHDEIMPATAPPKAKKGSRATGQSATTDSLSQGCRSNSVVLPHGSGHRAARDVLLHDPDEYPACHKTAWISLSSQQAPPASVSLTTWRMSLAPLHRLPNTFGPRAKVVGRWCSGPKLDRHVVSDTLAVGAWCDDSVVREIFWHAEHCSPNHQDEVSRRVPRNPVPPVGLRPRVVHPQVQHDLPVLCCVHSALP